MLLNKFFTSVFIRVTLIVLTSVLLGLVLQHLERGLYYTLSGVIFLIILQTWLLINQVNKTNSDLEKFFSSVHNQDSSVRFPEKAENNSFLKLHDRLNNLNTTIQNIKIENERTSQFLQSVVAHVDIGLLSFDTSGRIGIYNKTAKRYLKTQQLQFLSSIKPNNDELFEILITIKPGQEILHKIKIDSLMHSVILKATELRFESNSIKIISFQDITTELDKKELDSWQRLIRVLTHEIMNSISPITSLTSVIAGYFRNKEDESPVPPESVNPGVIERTLSGLNTIEETGKGLLGFVDKYRSLTLLPEPRPVVFSVGSMFRKCKQLMESGIPGNIELIIKVDPFDLSMKADQSQVEQVLINLIKNAIEAIGNTGKGIISLTGLNNEGVVLIKVEDNGIGISDAIAEDIFVPFYTTKQNGSGIGLSLSKQIMQNHNGSISVSSVRAKGAGFTLRFPANGV
jgi:nitrogen fixation/metabolism regulation signal transduction histidine kinase